MSGVITIREARRSDLDRMVDLTSCYRQRLVELEPQYWRPSARARFWTRTFFSWLMLRKSWIWVAERTGLVIGFVIALPKAPPPVFSPGTKTALIDDFYVDPGESFAEIAGILLNTVRPILRKEGYGQLVVVNAKGDTERGDFLETQGIRPVCQWSLGKS